MGSLLYVETRKVSNLEIQGIRNKAICFTRPAKEKHPLARIEQRKVHLKMLIGNCTLVTKHGSTTWFIPKLAGQIAIYKCPPSSDFLAFSPED